MSTEKKLIHFNKFDTFNSKKLSANTENTKYTLGVNGEIKDGSPDISYQSICWIKDTRQQWTHGQLYIIESPQSTGKLKIEPGAYDATTGEPIEFWDSFGNTVPAFRTEKFTLNRYVDTCRINGILDLNCGIVLYAWDKSNGSFVGVGSNTYINVGSMGSFTYGDGTGCFNFLSSPSGFTYDFSQGQSLPNWWMNDYEYSIAIIGPKNLPNYEPIDLNGKYLQLMGDLPCSNKDIDNLIYNVFTYGATYMADVNDVSLASDFSESAGIGNFE